MLPLPHRKQRLRRDVYIEATSGLKHLLSTLHERRCHRHMQDSLPAGWLAFTGRELNPLDRNERFPSCYISFPFPGFILTLALFDPGRALAGFNPAAQQSHAAAELCYPFGRKHGRHGGDPMRRRDFMALLGATAGVAGNAVWSLAARAQPASIPVVGFLGGATAAGYAKEIASIREGLQDAGFVEGKNAAFEFRWADGKFDQLPELAADLISRKVSVIVTTGGPLPARAAKAATATIPIVFATGGDPVAHGLVPKLSGSKGNITGVSFLNTALMPKRLEIIREAVPEARVFAMLVNSNSQSFEADSMDIRQAARSIGAQIHIIHAAGQGDPDSAFAEVVRNQVAAVLVHPDSVLYSRIGEIVGLAARHRVPTIYFSRECLEQGGLMSYGPALRYVLRQAGVYAGRILKGEKPSDLPVQQPTKFELVIKLKAAKALGLTVPPALLARADEVIE